MLVSLCYWMSYYLKTVRDDEEMATPLGAFAIGINRALVGEIRGVEDSMGATIDTTGQSTVTSFPTVREAAKIIFFAALLLG